MGVSFASVALLSITFASEMRCDACLERPPADMENPDSKRCKGMLWENRKGCGSSANYNKPCPGKYIGLAKDVWECQTMSTYCTGTQIGKPWNDIPGCLGVVKGAITWTYDGQKRWCDWGRSSKKIHSQDGGEQSRWIFFKRLRTPEGDNGSYYMEYAKDSTKPPSLPLPVMRRRLAEDAPGRRRLTRQRLLRD